jgi:hypothetical protein
VWLHMLASDELTLRFGDGSGHRSPRVPVHQWRNPARGWRRVGRRVVAIGTASRQVRARITPPPTAPCRPASGSAACWRCVPSRPP